MTYKVTRGGNTTSSTWCGVLKLYTELMQLLLKVVYLFIYLFFFLYWHNILSALCFNYMIMNLRIAASRHHYNRTSNILMWNFVLLQLLKKYTSTANSPSDNIVDVDLRNMRWGASLFTAVWLKRVFFQSKNIAFCIQNIKTIVFA
jgi:hypothetical protein